MASEEKTIVVQTRGSATRLLAFVALVLLLALALFFTGWSFGRGGDGAAVVRGEVAGLCTNLTAAAEQRETRLNARLDRIEGKLDALLRIATAVPPDLKPTDR